MSLLFAVAVARRLARALRDDPGLAVDPAQGVRSSPSLVIWVRVAWPRLREDQLQRLAWVWLVPLALAQLLLTGVVGW